MALYWVCKTISVAGNKLLAGKQIDDGAYDITALQAAGTILVAVGASATVDALGAKAQAGHLYKGSDEAALDAIMSSAIEQSQQSTDSTTVSTTNLASVSAGKGAALVGVQDSAAQITATTVEAALAEIFAKFVGISLVQIVTGTIASGLATVTVGAGQVVSAATRAFPVPMAVVTGSTNFGCLSHVFASNVAGGSGVGQVLFKALGNDGATDVDAAGTFAAILIN